MNKNKLNFIHILTLLCLFVFAFSTHSAASQKDGLLKIYFFDVGQGDAVFIESPNGTQVLIDGGPDSSILSGLGGAMPFYDRDIDIVVATHPHSDHIGGLIEVLERYEVANIIETKDGYQSTVFERWKKTVKKENANEIEAKAGKIIGLGNGITLTILAPFKSYDGVVLKNPHEANVTAVLEYGSFRMMLTGDMETPMERQLLLQGEDVSADVLKVGHHGSKTSTTAEFLSAVNPAAAFIQVGMGNRYKHPSPEVVSRLENFGVRYYRTDLDGSIKIVSDGRSFKAIKY